MADAEPVRVLVVDDEPYVLDLFALVLGPRAWPAGVGSGFELMLCRTANEAVASARLALAENHPFALALLDVHLRPGPDGLWCAEQLRGLDAQLQLVLMTGLDDPDLAEAASRVPPPDRFLFLRKPIHRAEIQQFVISLGAKWRAERKVRLAQSELEAHVAARTAELAEANALLRQENVSRLQIEGALSESERRYRELFDSSTEMLLVHDFHGHMLMVNRVACDTLGHTFEQLSALTVHDLEMPDRAARHTARLCAVLAQGATVFESQIVTSHGHVIPVEVRSRLVELGGQRVILSSLRDMTEHRRLEEQFRQSQKMEALGALAGGLAHDLSNLLTVINEHCQLLLGAEDLPTAWRAEAHEVLAAGASARELIQQLLVLSRHQPAELQVLDLAVALRDLQPMLRRLIGEQYVIEAHLPPQSVTVRANLNLITQIVMNLAINARDAMPTGGALTLALEVMDVNAERVAGLEGVQAGAFACLRVRDTGCGMGPEVLGHLFEPFFTTKPTGQGAGLGLATVYGLVRQLGGLIEVDSVPGAGSEFRVLLPLEAVPQAAAPSPTVPAGQAVLTAAGGRMVLVVEDERGVRDLAAHMLRRLGYHVLTAESGAAALGVMAEHGTQVDLVLSDVITPGMQGRELGRRLRAAGYRARILFMSGYSGEELSRGDVEPLGELLGKPFSLQMLAHRVSSALAGD